MDKYPQKQEIKDGEGFFRQIRLLAIISQILKDD